MHPMSIVEDTERTRFCPQTDKVMPVYPPLQRSEAGDIRSEAGGIIMAWCQRGNDPSSEAMMTLFTDADMQH